MSSASALSPSSVDGPPAPPSDQRITLQVGERHFTTLASTLSERSTFFASLLSERWAGSKSNDVSYFVDADPEIFAHVLRYLRHGTLPLFYDKTRGFDYGAYQALRSQAAYFGIQPLRKWIKEKGYARAVKIQYRTEELHGQATFAADYDTTVDGDTERSYQVCSETEMVYQCPRGIVVHEGRPEACGRVCQNAKGQNGNTFMERAVWRTLVITKKTVFSPAELKQKPDPVSL